MTHGDGNISVHADARPVLVTLTGDIDIRTVTESARQRLSLVETDGEIVVDLSDVGFVDSVGITVLLELRHYAGAGVRLQHPPEDLRRLLDVTGVTSLFVVEA